MALSHQHLLDKELQSLQVECAQPHASSISVLAPGKDTRLESIRTTRWCL